ncbi:sigma D regulator [Celerinatantimonas diazotrophica]|uniref:Regulator of sigma D n=1 Tax=Celerinatantimonas diazotrophica TaxID=412034 RepID=A0A4R1KF04_9GAMM|nr:sigma D regulator [Celerinatantimonas diazotrophica]TCK63194.1 regulator of sigma D [Celerinatantimonas diazotrophica]CAG9295563.1 Regulator of sigma D [Celerinatantimonas diazotrophica]
MLKRVAQAQQRWGGASQVIDNWLAERSQLIVEYCQLVGQKQPKSMQKLPQLEQIQHFCHHLVDYVSTGHFGVFDQIIEDCQDYRRVHGYIQQLAPTTEIIVDFYDKYVEVSDLSELNEFIDTLGIIGESLENRFAIEDKLLAELYQHVVAEQAQTNP